MKRPEYLKDDHLNYLSELEETGMVNMFRAVPTLMMHYNDLTKEEARKILAYWWVNLREAYKGDK